MGASAQSSWLSPQRSGWTPAAIQVLESAHLCAWSGCRDERLAFGRTLARSLAKLAHAEVRQLVGIEVFEAVSGGPAGTRDRSWRWGPAPWHGAGPAAPPRFRFHVWHEADVLLARDPAAFALIVESFVGAAAELEFVDDDRLVIQRLVLVGGLRLEAFFKDPAGPCRRWLDDGESVSRWAVNTGVAAPSFVGDRVATLLAAR